MAFSAAAGVTGPTGVCGSGDCDGTSAPSVDGGTVAWVPCSGAALGAPVVSNAITGSTTGGSCGVPDKRATATILVMLNVGTFRS